MADGLLVQGKEYGWLVEDDGSAHVLMRDATEYATRLDQVDSTTIYIGKAAIGTATSAASWRVKRMTLGTDGDVTIEFADGDANFDNIWDNRASLTYS